MPCLPCLPRYALDHIPKNQATSLYQRFVSFEKQHGDRQGIEDVVVSKRRWVCKQGPLDHSYAGQPAVGCVTTLMSMQAAKCCS
jgi:hypothetical protein